ncbi:MAG: hypothetical protein WCP19_14125 [Chloroflexota bacterium]
MNEIGKKIIDIKVGDTEKKLLKSWFAPEVYRIDITKTMGGGLTGPDSVGIPFGTRQG